ncbi:KIR protein [Plasmodium coatneyi]|uniref:KIR protein n=1 Tax=Plasmodium coatneyi TaxID=208452 RepID=A0A1B1DTM6_9APIC|nr:KIR protein [Plasmodium coatneyi]ANQ05957.1 KIR protein [Plasmodium coatneyi]
MAPLSQKVNLKELPSKTEFYDIFDAASGYNYCPNGVEPTGKVEQLRSKLNDYTGLKDQERCITKAYCYACSMKKKQPSDHGKTHLEGASCRFFYYWMGNKYPRPLDEEVFSDLMDDIYRTLGALFHNEECVFQYRFVNKTTFEPMKKIYEHYHDCNYVKQYLEQHLQERDQQPDAEWADYVDKVTKACTAVEAQCNGGTTNNESYCDEYNSTYKAYCDGVSQTSLTCSKVKEREPGSDAEAPAEQESKQAMVGAPGPHTATPLVSDGLQSSDGTDSLQGSLEGSPISVKLPHMETLLGDGGQLPISRPGSREGGGSQPSHTTTSTDGSGAAVGGGVVPGVSCAGLALVGLPTIMFLLYKYTSAFSSIKDFFRGGGGGNSTNNRNGRGSNSNSRNRGKRSIKHEVDTLTDTSTGRSTIDSTAGGDDLSDDSSLYTAAPSVRANNNRRQRHNRNNISYGRM